VEVANTCLHRIEPQGTIRELAISMPGAVNDDIDDKQVRVITAHH